ncbi:Hypothetical predicted protein, partial [Marmota monax]
TLRSTLPCTDIRVDSVFLRSTPLNRSVTEFFIFPEVYIESPSRERVHSESKLRGHTSPSHPPHWYIKENES